MRLIHLKRQFRLRPAGGLHRLHARIFAPVDSSENHDHRQRRFARIRRVKALLRYAPRRARFHHYPFIGRFADVARKRAYLWSFRKEHVRPALYAGSIIALLPIMGIQVPTAFCMALLLRANVMVLVGLQFITNPLTAIPLYFLTYEVGHFIIRASGFGTSVELDPSTAVSAPPTESLLHSPPAHLSWTQGLGTAFNAWVIGGIVVGALLGLVLDIIWRNAVHQAQVHKVKVAERQKHSDSTPPAPRAE